jgi:hypothetical protein
MRSRVLSLCLLAYPRPLRRRDGDELLDLAQDLAARNGTAREALGLLRGGLVERLSPTPTRRAVAGSVAGTALVLTALAWTATAQGGRVEEDVFSCSAHCGDPEAEVAARVQDGWTCTHHREAAAVSWRCTRD